MGRCGIGEVVPAIVFGLGANAPLHGIVAHINQIGAGFLVSVFGGAPVRAFKQGPFPVTGFIVNFGKGPGHLSHKSRKHIKPFCPHRLMKVVRHLAQA